MILGRDFYDALVSMEKTLKRLGFLEIEMWCGNDEVHVDLEYRSVTVIHRGCIWI